MARSPSVYVVLTLATVMFIGLTAYNNSLRLRDANDSLRHTQSVLAQLQDHLSLMQDAETGERGYLLTGDPKYRAPYQAALQRVAGSLEALRAATTDDPIQQDNLRTLRRYSEERLEQLADIIAVRDRSGLDAAIAIVRTDRGQRTMNALRAMVSQMMAREESRLREKSEAFRASAARDFRLLVFWAPVSWLMLGVLGSLVAIQKPLERLVRSSRGTAHSARRAAVRYVIATLAVLAATALRWWLSRLYGDIPPFVTYFPTILLIALLAGSGPGIFATTLSAVLADYLFIRPYGSLGISSPADVLAFALFICTCLGLCVLAARLQQARLAQAADHEKATLGAALSNIADGVIVCDASGRATFANAAAGALVGISTAASPSAPLEKGLRIRDPVNGVVIDCLSPALLDSWSARGASEEGMIVRDDGAAIAVEISAARLQHAAGEEAGWVVTLHDVRERNLANERFRLAMDAAATGMFMVDKSGTILLVNTTTERLFGYTRAELVGQPIDLLIPPRVGVAEPSWSTELSPPGSASAEETVGRTRTRLEFPIELHLTPLDTAAGRFVVGSIVDIGERQRAMNQLRTLNEELAELVSRRTLELKEREVLLQEVHHRVKNNLQVIISLIDMQVRTLSDKATRAALEECGSRVQTMAQVHDMLHRSRDYGNVPFADFARDLVGRVFDSGSPAPGIALEFDLENVTLGVGQAIPCGLILNELVTNALKHAFPHSEVGLLRVALRRQPEGEARLSVGDTGIGLAPEVNLVTSATLGLQLVTTLVEQLDGRLEVIRQPGTTFNISFPLERAA